MPSCDPHRVSDISIRDMPLTLAVLLLIRLALISRYRPCCWVYSTLLTLCLETRQTIGFPTGREFRNEYVRWSAQGEQFGGQVREGRLSWFGCVRKRERRNRRFTDAEGWVKDGVRWREVICFGDPRGAQPKREEEDLETLISLTFT